MSPIWPMAHRSSWFNPKGGGQVYGLATSKFRMKFHLSVGSGRVYSIFHDSERGPGGVLGPHGPVVGRGSIQPQGTQSSHVCVCADRTDYGFKIMGALKRERPSPEKWSRGGVGGGGSCLGVVYNRRCQGATFRRRGGGGTMEMDLEKSTF